jgi:hypothetical protein
MGVGEVMVSRQMEPTGHRVGPNDPVVGATLSRTMLGFEDDEVLGVRHAFSQSTRRDHKEKQCRGNEPHHGVAFRKRAFTHRRLPAQKHGQGRRATLKRDL